MAKSDYACCAKCGNKCVYNPDSEAVIYCDSCFQEVEAERDRYKKALEKIRIALQSTCDSGWNREIEIIKTALADVKL